MLGPSRPNAPNDDTVQVSRGVARIEVDTTKKRRLPAWLENDENMPDVEVTSQASSAANSDSEADSSQEAQTGQPVASLPNVKDSLLKILLDNPCMSPADVRDALRSQGYNCKDGGRGQFGPTYLRPLTRSDVDNDAFSGSYYLKEHKVPDNQRVQYREMVLENLGWKALNRPARLARLVVPILRNLGATSAETGICATTILGKLEVCDSDREEILETNFPAKFQSLGSSFQGVKNLAVKLQNLVQFGPENSQSTRVFWVDAPEKYRANVTIWNQGYNLAPIEVETVISGASKSYQAVQTVSPRVNPGLVQHDQVPTGSQAVNNGRPLKTSKAIVSRKVQESPVHLSDSDIEIQQESVVRNVLPKPVILEPRLRASRFLGFVSLTLEEWWKRSQEFTNDMLSSLKNCMMLDVKPVYLGWIEKYTKYNKPITPARLHQCLEQEFAKMTEAEYVKHPARGFFCKKGNSYVPIEVTHHMSNREQKLFEIDHIVPRSSGGLDHPFNYVIVHYAINSLFGDNPEDMKRVYYGNQVVDTAKEFHRINLEATQDKQKQVRKRRSSSTESTTKRNKIAQESSQESGKSGQEIQGQELSVSEFIQGLGPRFAGVGEKLDKYDYKSLDKLYEALEDDDLFFDFGKMFGMDLHVTMKLKKELIKVMKK